MSLSKIKVVFQHHSKSTAGKNLLINKRQRGSAFSAATSNLYKSHQLCGKTQWSEQRFYVFHLQGTCACCSLCWSSSLITWKLLDLDAVRPFSKLNSYSSIIKRQKLISLYSTSYLKKLADVVSLHFASYHWLTFQVQNFKTTHNEIWGSLS